VALGLALRGVATAAADVSDGLLGDLGHVLKASSLGARIEAPAALGLMGCADAPLSPAQRLDFALAGGDDYELVFTAPPSARGQVKGAVAQAQVQVTRIGSTTAAPGVQVVDAQGQPLDQRFGSFDHFG
jgi:thiamine-monophosphate kinase